MDLAIPVRRAVATQRWAADTRRTLLLVVGAVACGIALQQVASPSPLALTSFAVALTVALSLLGILSRRPWGTLLGGFRFGATILLCLGGAAAIGTLVLQQKPAGLYPRTYGPLGGALWGLGLGNVAHSFWFAALVALFSTGVILSMALRWPIRARNAGFFALHLGLLVALSGAAVSSLTAVKGRVDLHLGETAATARLERNGEATETLVPLGFTVKLEQFLVDRYADEVRLAVYQPNANGEWTLKASFPVQRNATHRLPGGGRFTVKAFYPDVAVHERVEPAPPGGPPALQLFLDGEERWLVDGKDRVDSPDGKLAIALGADVTPSLEAAPRHWITVQGQTRAVELGQPVDLAGLRIKPLRFFQRFNYDLESQSAMDLPSGPDNPALEVEIVRDGRPVARRWLYARLPSFDHRADDLPQLTYRFEPAARVATAVLVTAARSLVTTVEDGRRQTQPYREGLLLGQGRVRLGQLLSSAKLVRELSSRSDQPLDPVADVAVGGVPGSAGGQTLLSARERSAVGLAGGAVLTLEKREPEVRAYQSRVTVTQGADERQGLIAVNAPFAVGPWKLYQVNYDPKDPTYSGFEAVKDPGVFWVFLGFGLIGLGVVYTLTLERRGRRAKEA